MQVADNIYRVLGIQTREDCVSNALAYAFNHSSRFRQSFLSVICDKAQDDYEECHAYTRVSSGNGIPDIILVCRSGAIVDLVIIENKLKADEGADQTERYSAVASIEFLRKRLCPACTVRPSFIFLTLFPDQEPISSMYTTRNYGLLAPIAPDYEHSTNLAEILIHDWLHLISRFYDKATIHPDDDILAKLRDEEGLESGYLYFRELFSALTLLHELEVDYFFRSSQQGRRYYGAQITKNQWHPSEMVADGGKLRLDGDRNFYIHFEPQYDVLNHLLKVYLHYEVYPYRTEAWVRSNIAKHEYDSYVARRTRFSEKLQVAAPKDWALSLGYNQIARADIDFRGKSCGDVRVSLERLINDITPAIDEVNSAL